MYLTRLLTWYPKSHFPYFQVNLNILLSLFYLSSDFPIPFFVWETGRLKSAREAKLGLRPDTYLRTGLWVEVHYGSCCRCCLLCEAVRQAVIHLASRVLFSLAFLNPVLGITSSPEQEGIPVIMCSAKAASGSPQWDTDAAVWQLGVGHKVSLCLSADIFVSVWKMWTATQININKCYYIASELHKHLS